MRKQNPLDKENLRQVILDSTKQIAEGLNLAKNIKVKGNFSAVEISGMGGSSLPANILRIYLSSLYRKHPKTTKRLAVYQNRFYKLPHEAYRNCLNFFSSYSGNTEETIAALRLAIRHKLPSVGFASGGKISEICTKNKIPLIAFPSGLQPRYAMNYSFAAMLKVLINSVLIPDTTKDLVKMAKKIDNNARSFEAQGKKVAQKLVGKTPLIYSSTRFKALAMIWKIKINENAKTPAFHNFYPELNHNEMLGFTLPQGKFHVITLIDKKDLPQNLKRMKVTAELFKKKGIGTTMIEMQDSNIFNTIFSTLILGDWVSYYLALAYKQDPTPVDMVEEFKKLI
jgi:glucose/mannose-6-phosphate isomerase